MADPLADQNDRTLKLARSFARDWLRPNDPDNATPELVDTLVTTMLAFFATASRPVAIEACQAAWQTIKANRPPEGQAMFSNVREAIDTIDKGVSWLSR